MGGTRRLRMFTQEHKDGQCWPNANGYCKCPLRDAPDEESAELVCSDVTDMIHMPVIDIDFPCRLVESGTPGHFHLYIDKQMSQFDYFNMIKAMCDAGVVQWQWFDTTRERGYSSVRHPDKPKEKADG